MFRYCATKLLWNPLRTRAIPERFCGGDCLWSGAISSVCTFTFTVTNLCNYGALSQHAGCRIHNTFSWFVKMSNRIVCFWQPSCTCTMHDSSTTFFTTSDSFQHMSRSSTCWRRAWWWVAAVGSNAPENISSLGKSTGPVSLIFPIV